ncbi:hypothetical protein BDY21DRAFT_420118 [Lineolata rhizophorae]|uniref:C2H2-type domain-containing protein n=1 Tax=Lineolata rhizophorae TaxID=578093 RepID=A0A6A6P6J5_9PEZI|nr:hypothetical protein BDY21DRAFT_420118 [Lineolata rhizophorae]
MTASAANGAVTASKPSNSTNKTSPSSSTARQMEAPQQLLPQSAFPPPQPPQPPLLTKTGRIKKTYTCRGCHKVFKRSEHCTRHERVHTQEKPFSCRYCDRRYARKDLVKRHERTLHAAEFNAAAAAQANESNKPTSSNKKKDKPASSPSPSSAASTQARKSPTHTPSPSLHHHPSQPSSPASTRTFTPTIKHERHFPTITASSSSCSSLTSTTHHDPFPDLAEFYPGIFSRLDPPAPATTSTTAAAAAEAALASPLGIPVGSPTVEDVTAATFDPPEALHARACGGGASVGAMGPGRWASPISSRGCDSGVDVGGGAGPEGMAWGNVTEEEVLELSYLGTRGFEDEDLLADEDDEDLGGGMDRPPKRRRRDGARLPRHHRQHLLQSHRPGGSGMQSMLPALPPFLGEDSTAATTGGAAAAVGGSTAGQEGPGGSMGASAVELGGLDLFRDFMFDPNMPFDLGENGIVEAVAPPEVEEEEQQEQEQQQQQQHSAAAAVTIVSDAATAAASSSHDEVAISTTTTATSTLNNAAHERRPSDSAISPATLFHCDTPSFAHGQSRRLFEQLPQVLREKGDSGPPAFSFNEGVHRAVCADAEKRLGASDGSSSGGGGGRATPATGPAPAAAAVLPTALELQRFFTSYVDCFHRHLPVVHLASYDPAAAPSPLTLAMCAIGALYRLSRKRAAALYEAAARMLDGAVAESRARSPTSPCPLWVAQGKLLLSMFGIFSGQPAMVLGEMERLGFFVNEYRLRRAALANSSARDPNISWEDWIARESEKRLLCGFFISSNMVSVTYNALHAYSITEDLVVEMPDEERLWNARSAEHWQQLRADGATVTSRRTIREAMATLIFGESGGEDDDDDGAPIRISGFALQAIMHAVNIHMWNVLQFTQSFSRCAFDDAANEALRAHLISAASTALTRCHHVLTQGAAIGRDDGGGDGGGDKKGGPDPTAAAAAAAAGGGEDDAKDGAEQHQRPHGDAASSASATNPHEHPPGPGAPGSASPWNSHEGPLMFNCQALLRIAYVRLFTPASTYPRMTLLAAGGEGAEVAAAAAAYAAAPVRAAARSGFLTRAAATAYEGFLSPVRVGHLLVRKTAAFSWSIEHAVSAWDSALFLTKWVHTVERQGRARPPDPDEASILDQLRGLLAEVESDFVDAEAGRRSLAGAVARAWGSFLDDVWVWGCTPRMGFILKVLAAEYEKDFQKGLEEAEAEA